MLPGTASLHDLMWRAPKHACIAVVTPDAGDAVPHAKALISLLEGPLGKLRKEIVYCRTDESLRLSQHHIFIIGKFEDLGPAAQRLLTVAGYPGRYEPSCSDKCEPTIIDRMARANGVDGAASKEAIGIVYIGFTPDLPRRMIVFITGSSLRGIEAAALWAMDDDLRHIEQPTGCSQYPLEALVAAYGSSNQDPAPSDIHTLRLSNVNSEFDFATEKWIESPMVTHITVTKRHGVVSEVRIGANIIKMTNVIWCQMLEFLIKRSSKQVWTSDAEAAEHIYGSVTPRLLNCVRNLRSQIVKQVIYSHPNLMRMQEVEGIRQYILDAEISYVNSASAVVAVSTS